MSTTLSSTDLTEVTCNIVGGTLTAVGNASVGYGVLKLISETSTASLCYLDYLPQYLKSDEEGGGNSTSSSSRSNDGEQSSRTSQFQTTLKQVGKKILVIGVTATVGVLLKKAGLRISDKSTSNSLRKFIYGSA